MACMVGPCVSKGCPGVHAAQSLAVLVNDLGIWPFRSPTPVPPLSSSNAGAPTCGALLSSSNK